MPQRESGYYWAIPIWSLTKKPLIVSLDIDGDYSVCGDGIYYKEDDFEFLDLPRIKNPGEQYYNETYKKDEL